MVTDEKGLMGREGDCGFGRGVIKGGHKDNTGEAWNNETAVVVVVKGRPEFEQSNLGSQFINLTLQLLLHLVCLLVALLAHPHDTCVVQLRT